MPILTSFIIIAYFLCCIAIFFYGINCYVLIALFKRRFKAFATLAEKNIATSKHSAFEWPEVCVQCPIYNEKNVIRRLLDAVAALDYPDAKLTIQVLDDSTDATRQEVEACIAALAKERPKLAISHVSRSDRKGYKAGALKVGLAATKAPIIAIFDADFIPNPRFLKATVPTFSEDPKIGFVQARWGYINHGKSLLTRAISLGIDGHFVIEQAARAWNGLFLNFNGTAGLFRRQAIIDAGNWHSDTLTEDMDLSYRIQLAGYRGRFIYDEVVPSEIPERISDFKSQQYRWAKGSIQTAMKLLPTILKSSASRFKKLQAFLHVTHYSLHPLMLTLAVMSLPILVLSSHLNLEAWRWPIWIFMIASICAPTSMYITAIKAADRQDIRWWMFPVLTVIGIGMSVNNSKAVIDALLKRPSGFVRTPKRGDANVLNYRLKRDYSFLVEIALGLYCFASFCIYVQVGKYFICPFIAIYTVGYLSVGTLTLHQYLDDSRQDLELRTVDLRS